MALGSYERSCFGCSLETLCYLKVPIRDIPIGKLMEFVSNYFYFYQYTFILLVLYFNLSIYFFKENNKNNLTSDPYPVPKEVWYLVDHLYRHGLKQEHLFEQPGLRSELIQIRNWLDSGTPDTLRTVFFHYLFI